MGLAVQERKSSGVAGGRERRLRLGASQWGIQHEPLVFIVNVPVAASNKKGRKINFFDSMVAKGKLILIAYYI